jgi:hypothetical protein
MTFLLSPRLWIALALIVVLGLSHRMAYRAGAGAVQTQWDKDRARHLAQALEAERAARQREQQLVAERKKLEDRYVDEKRKAAAAAAGARTELDRLRDELAAPRRPASEDPAPAARVDDRAGPERELLGHCATALVGMAQEADRLETVVVGLQQYVKQVCLRP